MVDVVKSPSAGLAPTLRALRERREFTQAELGARAAMAAASVSHFETGQRLPSLDSLVKLADALEVSVDTLLGRAPMDARVDPIFLRASRADAQTLGTVKRVTAALLEGVEADLSSDK
jgi:transcriptional regulator with XRE-family HTH domain